MRLNRTGSVLGAACLLVGAGACGSSRSTAASSAPTRAAGVSGGSLHCDKAPKAPGTDAHLALPSTRTVHGKQLTAVLRTNCGAITMQLNAAKAPQTVASFVQLAGRYWDDNPCHRLTTQGIYVLQCGDPTGSPGYRFGIENAPANGTYPTGTVAMARATQPDTNGGQFFIVYADTRLPTDTGGYSVFGRITGGMDIVKAVAEAGTSAPNGNGAPTQPISILKVTVTEKKA